MDSYLPYSKRHPHAASNLRSRKWQPEGAGAGQNEGVGSALQGRANKGGGNPGNSQRREARAGGANPKRLRCQRRVGDLFVLRGSQAGYFDWAFASTEVQRRRHFPTRTHTGSLLDRQRIARLRDSSSCARPGSSEIPVFSNLKALSIPQRCFSTPCNALSNRHQGYGTLLMEEAERIARDEHMSTKLSVLHCAQRNAGYMMPDLRSFAGDLWSRHTPLLSKTRIRARWPLHEQDAGLIN
mmetsp:Transcript_32725/g.51049  ORF Transcript_32725/g.51049 Transcript_32725/m.51049 type:complete len:240 (+) Transcript_32725:838-1557(+)